MSDVQLSVKEYAEMVHRHPETIWRRIRRGVFTKFPVERDGRNITIIVPVDTYKRLSSRRFVTTRHNN